MRSIRRSLLAYLLLLVAVALGAVGVLVDRIAGAALRDREAAEGRRIDQASDHRRDEVRERFDAELLSESRARALDFRHRFEGLIGQGPGRGPGGRAGDATPDPAVQARLQAPPDEVHEFQVRVASLLAGAASGPASGWSITGPAAAVDPPRQPRPAGPPRPGGDAPRPPSPAWLAFDAPRAVARIRDALRKQYVDDPTPGYFQFNLFVITPDRVAKPAGVVRSPRLTADLPLDPAVADITAEVEHPTDDVPVPGGGPFRRITLARPNGGSPLLFWLPLPTPAGLTGGDGSGRRSSFLAIWAIVQQARPVSDLDALLDEVGQDRDGQLARVRAGTRADLDSLRTWLGGIVGASFLALAVGGWVIVARGLSPIGKLSHAVSRVSERDFRLPVGRDEMSRELAPIHDRMSTALDLLRRAFEREKQAVADISHELRTPIASLLATIDVTLRKPRSPDQYRAVLEDCRAIAKQLGHLVERIMTLASLDAGTARPAVGRADAAAVAAACAAVIRPLAEAHGLTFVAPPPAAAELTTDPDQLREVLVNLLHNAVEYNRPGGRVELHVRRAPGRVLFEVRDTGIGMPAEVRERIFERFYRADPSRHATGVHAGLGLAIVKEYVERLGGTIEVESEPGVGSTFRVAFPAEPARPHQPAPPPEPVPPAPRPRPTPAPARS